MSLKPYTDSELLSLLRQGVESGFTEIYNRYWKNLLVVAVNKTGDLDEAEEIVQDIFVSLWNRRETLEITSSLNNYLAVSVKYRVIKALAKKITVRNLLSIIYKTIFYWTILRRNGLNLKSCSSNCTNLLPHFLKSAGLCTSSAGSRVILRNRLQRNLVLPKKPWRHILVKRLNPFGTALTISFIPSFCRFFALKSTFKKK